MTRRSLLQTALGAAFAAGRGKTASAGKIGIAWTSYMSVARPRGTLAFLEHAHALGAGGIQTTIQDDPAAVRKLAAKYGMYVEAMVSLPKSGEAGAFERQLETAKAAGAAVVRAGALSGRRYETFATLAGWRAFARESEQSVAAAVPLLEKHKIRLALENHKDRTADELVVLLKKHSSEYLGACLDFGNNISLLDDPMEVAEKLAPYTFATHLKDMGVEPYEDGFLLSEVPLGRGFLDLKKMIALVRQSNPETHLSLEMITRDPLEVPCLTDKYWATFPDRNGLYLARTLRLVHEKRSREPLQRISGLSHEQQLKAEEQNVRDSLDYAEKTLDL
ncbi:MAG TPA: TIM barrel protein [Bryobacteraceae bacterium]|jgi:sugar phosphate isomerase/epimerase|nr:TIM barrel protein [Bryobacteraceae bacterium]